jgi:DNA repair photolyase
MARIRYQELQCKSVLNRVKGMPFAWSINPYRGCVHSCHYCYARGTHTYLDLDTDDDFSSIIFVKSNAPAVLRAELSRPGWRREGVSVGTATDPYQPAEGRFRVTRGVLEALHDYRTPVTIVTKGTLALRDVDLLAAMAARAGCTVCFSVPTVDVSVWRATEPGTAPPAKRLAVMERLVAAGVHAGVMAAPIIPGLSGTSERLDATVRAVAAHGARFLWTGILHVGPLVRDHYLQFLHAEYPDLAPLHERLYGGKYAPRAVNERLHAQVAALKARYGLQDLQRPERAHTPAQLELGFAVSA